MTTFFLHAVLGSRVKADSASYTVLHFCTLLDAVGADASQGDGVRETKSHQTSIQL